MRESRLPYVLAMIERMGLEAFLASEVAAVRARPVPMRLVERIAREDELTPHEVRVLALCAHGLTRSEVAKVLGCGSATVKSHLDFAYRKLGARNRAHALALATERGYFE